MVSPGKPETDWLDIRRRFEKGEPANAIAKTVPVSKQAILKKAKRQAWGDPVASLATEATGLVPAATAALEVATSKRSPDNAALILAAIRKGATQELAAQAAGIDRDTLRDWQRDDKGFSAEIKAAKAHWACQRIENINKAGDRGDWRADAHLLGKNPETRDIWGDNAGAGTSGITLNINIARAETPANEADIVDVTPERTGA